jgi:hypothetical protein
MRLRRTSTRAISKNRRIALDLDLSKESAEDHSAFKCQIVRHNSAFSLLRASPSKEQAIDCKLQSNYS